MYEINEGKFPSNAVFSILTAGDQFPVHQFHSLLKVAEEIILCPKSICWFTTSFIPIFMHPSILLISLAVSKITAYKKINYPSLTWLFLMQSLQKNQSLLVETVLRKSHDSVFSSDIHKNGKSERRPAWVLCMSDKHTWLLAPTTQFTLNSEGRLVILQ